MRAAVGATSSRPEQWAFAARCAAPPAMTAAARHDAQQSHAPEAGGGGIPEPVLERASASARSTAAQPLRGAAVARGRGWISPLPGEEKYGGHRHGGLARGALSRRPHAAGRPRQRRGRGEPAPSSRGAGAGFRGRSMYASRLRPFQRRSPRLTAPVRIASRLDSWARNGSARPGDHPRRSCVIFPG